jgi:hypothetical protein
METHQDHKRRYTVLTRQIWFYGVLAVSAFGIGSMNLIALFSSFWKPTLLLISPLLMMFAAVGFWACVNFLRTRSRLLFYRDHPEDVEDTSVEFKL